MRSFKIAHVQFANFCPKHNPNSNPNSTANLANTANTRLWTQPTLPLP